MSRPKILKCQLCGRKPAKRFSFTAHQGFVLIRREIDFSGTYCRDCAIEAYAHARGISLKGMWFAPGALVRGAVSTLWDSTKLLDLPPEVTDAPWVPHKIGCSHCGCAIKTFAGECECENCKSRFVVVSCIHCKTVNTVKTAVGEDAVSIRRCRTCSKRTEAPTAARNTPRLLFGRMLSEIAGRVHDDADPLPIDEWLAAFIGDQPMADETARWLWDIFDRRIKDRNMATIRATTEAGILEGVHSALEMAFVLCTRQQRVLLEPLAARFGWCLGENSDEPSNQSFNEACEILGVSSDVTKREAEKAYRKLALQFHPDRITLNDENKRDDSVRFMKAVNAAFDMICKQLELSDRSQPDDLTAMRNPEAASEIRRRVAAARSKSGSRAADHASSKSSSEAATPASSAEASATADESFSRENHPRNADKNRHRVASFIAVLLTAILPAFCLLALYAPQHPKEIAAPDSGDTDATPNTIQGIPAADEPTATRSPEPITAPDTDETDTNANTANGIPTAEGTAERPMSAPLQGDAKPRETTELDDVFTTWAAGDYHGVIQRCNSAFANGADESTMVFIQGWAWAKLGRWSEAVRHHAYLWETQTPYAADFNRDFAYAYFELGKEAADSANFAMEEGRDSEAQQLAANADNDLSWAILLDPTLARAYQYRAFVRELQGMRESAETDASEAKRLKSLTPPQLNSIILSPKRLWSDDNGRYSTTATLMQASENRILLRKVDGSRTWVPTQRLSLVDRIWLAELRGIFQKESPTHTTATTSQ